MSKLAVAHGKVMLSGRGVPDRCARSGFSCESALLKQEKLRGLSVLTLRMEILSTL